MPMRGRGKNSTSLAKQNRDDGFRRDGGRGRRGCGGRLNPSELARALSPNSQTANQFHADEEKGYYIVDEVELNERLTAMHDSYFRPSKPISVTFKDIGMKKVEELRRAFAEYDAVRDGKGRDSKKLAIATAVLLGLKE